MPRIKNRSDRRRSNRHVPALKRVESQVLCVDDDDDLTRIFKARLQQSGIEVIRANNGREGLRICRSHRPDAIITDLCMDHGDGLYLLRRLKSKASTAAIPVIVISGTKDQKQIAEIENFGADAILRKPIPFDTLNQIIDQVIGKTTSSADHERSIVRTLDGDSHRVDSPHQHSE